MDSRPRSSSNRRRRAPSAPRVISGFRATTFNERLNPAILPVPPRVGPGLLVSTIPQPRGSRSMPPPPRISNENRRGRRQSPPRRPRRDVEEVIVLPDRIRQSSNSRAYGEARRPSDRDLSPVSEDNSDSVKKKCSILLCIFRNRAHGWQSHRLHVHPPENTTDTELFKHIRSAYRNELQGPWRRYFSLKALKYIAPLLVSSNFFWFYGFRLEFNINSCVTLKITVFD